MVMLGKFKILTETTHPTNRTEQVTDNHPVVMLADVRGKLHYSKRLTDELRNNDLETLKDVFHAQSTGNVEVH